MNWPFQGPSVWSVIIHGMSKWHDLRGRLYNVGRRNNIGESIANKPKKNHDQRRDTKRAPLIIGLTLLLSHFPTIIAFPTDHQDALIFHGHGAIFLPMDQSGKWGMALHKHTRIQRNLELVWQLRHSILFKLPTPIREKNEWYSVALEEIQGFAGSWEGIGAPQEHSINTIDTSIKSSSCCNGEKGTRLLTRRQKQNLKVWFLERMFSGSVYSVMEWCDVRLASSTLFEDKTRKTLHFLFGLKWLPLASEWMGRGGGEMVGVQTK